jgi:5'-nucleotidase
MSPPGDTARAVSPSTPKMYILVTNDDGVDAPGLLALKQGLEPLGRIVVVAPDRNWSASGHTKTLFKPLHVHDVRLADGSRAYATDGAPTDCVAIVMLGFLQDKPALVVSGINPAGNVAHDLTYSGTVAAAMEGAIYSVPSIAVSIDADHAEGTDFAPAAQVAAAIAVRVLAGGLPPDTFLNVNVPAMPVKDMRGVRITRLGQRIYRDALVQEQDEHGQTIYRIGGDPPSGLVEEGTDIGALAAHCVSITPVHLDMTSHALMERLRPWEDDGLLDRLT